MISWLVKQTTNLLLYIFRPASSKFSGSTESLKIPINLEKNVPEKKSVTKDPKKSNKKLDPPKKASQVSFNALIFKSDYGFAD